MQMTLWWLVGSPIPGNDGSRAGRNALSNSGNPSSGRLPLAVSDAKRLPIPTVGIFRTLVLALTIAAVGGCGYQLRGAVTLPPDLAAIHVDGPPVVSSALVLLLEGGGISVAPGPATANSVLKLNGERFDRRVLSVDSDTGKEREFELVYQVAFHVTGANGEELLAKQTVTVLRDYIFDPNAVLGKDREQSVLHAEMRRDAAARIVRRISVSLGGQS